MEEVPAVLPAALGDSAWPRVTVVTPSYNQAPFLEETIRSVLLQRYPNLEYFVMDGGSTDGSAEIIRKYERWLAGWVSEPDGGQADAINKGWRQARGEIVAYLNSDDVYPPGALRRAVEFLMRRPDVAIVYGACRIVDERSEPVGDILEMPRADFHTLLRSPLPQPTLFLRRSVLDRIGFLDVDLNCTMDWDFTLRAVLAGVAIEPIPVPPLAHVRVWGGAKTSNLYEPSIEESLRIRDRLLSDPTLPPSLIKEVALSKAWAFLWPAYQYYVRGKMRAARRLLHRAAATEPKIVTDPEFAGLYLRTLLGRRASRAARLLKARLERNSVLVRAAARLFGLNKSGWRSVPRETSASRRG